jgi:hypothetical protein
LNTIEQKFHVLKVADNMKTEYASQQLQGPTGVWWCHHGNTLPENMEVVWDQFKEAFWGHYVPVGLMAIKHTEFMKLTQRDKSITEYLHTCQDMLQNLLIRKLRRLQVLKEGCVPN